VIGLPGWPCGRKFSKPGGMSTRDDLVWRKLFFCAAIMLSAVGCEDPPPKKPKAEEPDAGKSGPAMDPKLAAAVQSAEAANAAGAEQGPPPTGVFGPGEADKAHAPGAPIEVTLIDKGAEPRAVLPAGTIGEANQIRVAINRSVPRGQLPPVEFVVALSLPKKDEDTDEPTSGPQPVAITVVKASAGQAQPEAGIDKMLATLEGSKIEVMLGPNGAWTGEKIVLGKEVKPPIDQYVVGLSDFLANFFSPMPKEPVGVGAAWIAHDRASVSGMQVVRYRVTKLDKKVGDEMAFTVDTRMYATDAKQLPGEVQVSGGEVALMGFVAQGKVAYTRTAGSLLPTSGQLKMPTVAQLANPQQPERVLPVQFETSMIVKPSAAKESGDKAKP
jgi:hypothetical protein